MIWDIHILQNDYPNKLASITTNLSLWWELLRATLLSTTFLFTFFPQLRPRNSHIPNTKVKLFLSFTAIIYEMEATGCFQSTSGRKQGISNTQIFTPTPEFSCDSEKCWNTLRPITSSLKVLSNHEPQSLLTSPKMLDLDTPI